MSYRAAISGTIKTIKINDINGKDFTCKFRYLFPLEADTKILLLLGDQFDLYLWSAYVILSETTV